MIGKKIDKLKQSISEQNRYIRKPIWWNRKQPQEIHLEIRTQKDKKQW